MTIKEIANWLLTLPEDVQASDLSSIVHGSPFTAKRVVAYRFKDGSGAGVYVESMGTHMKDEHGAAMEFLGYLSA
jgi:hypothetical protein